MAMDEAVFFDSGGVKVTSTRAILGQTTYPMQGITSVTIKAQKRAPSVFPFLLLIGGFVVMALGGAVGFPAIGALQKGEPIAETLITLALPALMGGGVMFVFGAGLTMTNKAPATVYVVTLGTSGGDRQGLRTTDKDHAEAVKASIEDALVARG